MLGLMIQHARAYLSGDGLGPSLIKAVFGSAGIRLLSMALAFLVGVQLARQLGAESYGVYGWVMAVAAILALPAEFGMPQLLVREVAANNTRSNWTLVRGILRWSDQAAWSVIALIGLICLVLWMLGIGADSNYPAQTMLLGVATIPFAVLVRLRGAALQGFGHVVRGQLPEAIVRPALLSLSLVLVYLSGTALSTDLALILGTLAAAFAFITASVMLREVMPSDVMNAPPETEAGRWWKSALPMALTEGMRALQGNVATILMGWLATAAAVGHFRIATAVAGMISVPITLAIIVGSPVIARLHAEGDRRRMKRLLPWLAASMTAGSILLSLPIFLAGDWLIAGIFGHEFTPSVGPLLVLCLGGIIYSAIGPSFILLNMTGHEARVTSAFLVSVVVLVVLAAPLIYHFGAEGAAAANSICFVMSNLLMWRDSKKLLQIDSSVFGFLDEGRPE